MGLEHIAPQIQADHEYQVRVETWGHLAPRKGTKYPIELTAAVGYFSMHTLNPIVLSVAPEDGPWYGTWFYDSLCNFLSEAIGREENSGKVMQFVGCWRNYKFTGKWTTLLKTSEGETHA